MRTKVTFIMPAYNAARYIGEAIGSLQAQTVREWKLIVVDDGSTDETASIVTRIAASDPRISMLRMESPSGSAYQPRKKAIMTADTPFVAPLDADDTVEPDYLARLWEALTADNADMAYPVMVTEKGPMADYSEFQGKTFKGMDCVKYTLCGWRINCNGGIIRRDIYLEAYRKFGGDLSYSYADELLTRQLLILASKVVFVPVSYYYRMNPESITHNLNPGAFDFIKCHISLEELIADIFGNGSEEYREIHRQLFYDYFLAMSPLCASGIKPEVRDYAMNEIKRCRKAIDRSMTRSGVSRRLSLLFPFNPEISVKLLSAFRPFFRI